MPDADLQKRVLEILEVEGSLSVSELAEKVGEEEQPIERVVSELETRNLVVISGSGRIQSESPVPISEIAFRGELTPTQSVIRYLYEEQGYGQSQIARMLDYSPGNIQTNLDRIKEKLGQELEQGEEDI
jgi:DNA-binding MarR family transcriptional regulator